MGWRFRKTFRVLPGIKLNVTARGLSATLGAAPFSINVGPRGVYRNVSIPGTGIWDRQRIGGLSPQSSDQHPRSDERTPPSFPVSPVSTSAIEIHSASTELLGSDSMEHLRSLVKDAYEEREALTNEISTATFEANTATNRWQKWDRGFLMKRLFKQSFADRKEKADTAVSKLEELREQLRLTTIATEITLDREQAEPYFQMRDEFAVLSGCQKIWNVLTEKEINRVAERSTANTAITRNPVKFCLDSCDLIQWEQKVPHLQNHTGGDMYVYPGFILYRASKQAFALIDFQTVTLKLVSMSFTETDSIPSDSQVTGQTWAKSNKDGSPDRRFHGNYQIPVVHYGSLLFSTSDGLDVRYMCSNPAFAERFAKAWSAVLMSFNSGVQSQNLVGTNSNDLLRQIEGGKQANERLMIAAGTFRVANEKFTNAMKVASHDDEAGHCKMTLSMNDFTTYTTDVLGFISAAKHLHENAPFVSHAAKAKYGSAVQGLETSWKAFAQIGDDGDVNVNGDAFVPFLNTVAAFSEAHADFSNAITIAVEKKCKKLGVA
jgi:hypothetical protein